MKSLTEPPWGKERWWIILYSPACFLGITSKGDTLKLSNGGCLNGPSTLLASTSLASLLSTISGCCTADRRLVETWLICGPWKCKWKPCKKTDINSWCNFYISLLLHVLRTYVLVPLVCGHLSVGVFDELSCFSLLTFLKFQRAFDSVGRRHCRQL